MAHPLAPEIAQAIDRAFSRPRALWATDVDGTLWSDDIGEAFLRELIADGALVSEEARGIDVWAEYERRIAVDRASGFAWAVQLMAGMLEVEVERRARELAVRFVPVHLFPEMKGVLELARARSVETWIVSASNQWIVTAAAALVGVDPPRVLGIRVAVRDGRLTTDLVRPLTYAGGKVEALSRLVGHPPTLVTGDSRGDLELLALATEAAVVIARPGGPDPALLAHGWSVHDPWGGSR